MNKSEKQKGSEKNTNVKKIWNKPGKIITLTMNELSKYINAAARSGACYGWGR